MTHWYEDWFNTEEYLKVYLHRNDADAKKLASLILKNIPLEKDAQILDMACGAGRHSVFFAKQGFKVTAVDLSEKLLKAAKKAALENDVKINFLKSDLRHFCIDSEFDLILNLFTSFGYFETDSENFMIIENAYQHLKKNGKFVLDFLNKNYLDKNLVKKSLDIINSGYVVQERNIEQNRIIKKIAIHKNGTEKNYMESVRLFSKDELVDGLEKIGFFIEKIFGDFDGNTFDLEASPRIIIIAVK